MKNPENFFTSALFLLSFWGNSFGIVGKMRIRWGRPFVPKQSNSTMNMIMGILKSVALVCIWYTQTIQTNTFEHLIHKTELNFLQLFLFCVVEKFFVSLHLALSACLWVRASGCLLFCRPKRVSHYEICLMYFNWFFVFSFPLLSPIPYPSLSLPLSHPIQPTEQSLPHCFSSRAYFFMMRILCETRHV